MAEKELTTQLDMKKQADKDGAIEVYLSDLIRALIKFWWVCVSLAVACAGVMAVFSFISYTPEYSVSATFTVQTQDISANGSGITSYSYFYNQSSAAQLSDTFPYILESNLLQTAVCEDLGTKRVPASISATSVAGTNMFTMTARGGNPQETYDVLISAMNNYPSIAEYVIGSSQLVMISEPVFPEEPSNSRPTLSYASTGLFMGLFLSVALIFVYVLTRDTVRTKEDIKEKVNQNCLGILPKVAFRKHSKKIDQSIIITNKLTGESFLETVRQLRNSVVSEIDDNVKSIMITSAAPDEGKTTVSINLAIALAKMEKKVILVDADLRNPSVKNGLCNYESEEVFNDDTQIDVERFAQLGLDTLFFNATEDNMWKIMQKDFLDNCMEKLKEEYDYIIVDAPPCALVAEPIIIASAVDTTILVVKQDTVRTTRIKYAIDSLQSVNAPILGCVLNCAGSGFMGYGYYYSGFGYSYNRYGYKKYGYGYGYSYGYGKK